MPTKDRLFGMAEMMDRTGYSDITIRRAIKSGRLPCRRQGPRSPIRFTEQDYAEYVRSLKVPANQSAAS